MMDWTDRHCRYFHRLLAPKALLFTEMVTAEAVIHAGADRFCRHEPAEHPLALQLGGSDPKTLAAAVRLCSEYGFDEFNLNVGCPSPRVRAGRFGACLMAEPELVAACVAAMRAETDRAVTVKCRIGIDDMDPIAGLDRFIEAQLRAGVRVVYLHSRKAWLSGLSPKENRDIPPLDYNRAVRLAQAYGELDVILNGGITKLSDVARQTNPHTDSLAGVMIGRAAYKTPLSLAEMTQEIHAIGQADLAALTAQMTAYAGKQIQDGAVLHQITRHMLGLFTGFRGAREWRRTLGETARLDPENAQLISDAAQLCLRLNNEYSGRKDNGRKVA